MEKLSDLPNIGKTVEKQLINAGVNSIEELKEMGAKKAWLMIQKIDKSACIHRLLALEGAIKGIKKSEISEKRKDELRTFYNLNKI